MFISYCGNIGKCCVLLADKQWLFHSGERIVAHGSLVLISQRKHIMWVLIRSTIGRFS